MNFNLLKERKENIVIRNESIDTVPDFVNGLSFGNAVGVGIQSLGGWWVVKDVVTEPDFPPVSNKNIFFSIIHIPLCRN